MVVQAYDLSIEEAEAGGLPCVQGQTVLHSMYWAKQGYITRHYNKPE